MNKPYRVAHLNALMAMARQQKIMIVPNLIVGYPEVDYEDTLSFIQENIDVIPWVNVNYFAIHNNNFRGELPIAGRSAADADQNQDWKS